MTAYEMAEIMIVHDGSQIWEHGEAIANMLRQQADRIAKLEHMNKNWQLSKTMAYNRIAELEKERRIDAIKQATVEPFGFVGYHEGRLVSFLQNDEQVNNFLEGTHPVGKVRPVYTTPQTKPLSDEEIMKTLWITGNEEPQWIEDRLKDARAIEERILGK